MELRERALIAVSFFAQLVCRNSYISRELCLAQNVRIFRKNVI